MNPQQPYPQQPNPQQPYSQPPYPQQPYAQQPYPQQPYPQQPVAPPPQKPAGSITLSRNTLIIIGAVVVVAVVIFLAVRPGGFLNSASSLTGTWYGPITISSGNESFTYEAFGTLQQTNGTLTGSAELCGNGGGSTHVEGGLTLNGTADGSNVSVTISVSGEQQPMATATGTYSISGGTASGQAASASNAEDSGSWTLSFHSGTEAQFRSACAQLPSR